MYYIDSLQLKNMINALYSSKQRSSKNFTLNGVEFGWQAIVDLWYRECERRGKGCARMVPRLREAYILRDSWTKLNVAPAKIMQVFLYYFIVLACIDTPTKHVARTGAVRVVCPHSSNSPTK